jgi:hypothetical protein
LASTETQRVLRLVELPLVCNLVAKGGLPLLNSPGMEVRQEWLRVATRPAAYLVAMIKGFRDMAVVPDVGYAGSAMARQSCRLIVCLALMQSEEMAGRLSWRGL